jgi:hypothetical protein
MANTRGLGNSAPAPAKRRLRRASRPRTPVPSDELIPIQFKMPPQFVRDFKIQAAIHGLKLNGLLKACFAAFMREDH